MRNFPNRLSFPGQRALTSTERPYRVQLSASAYVSATPTSAPNWTGFTVWTVIDSDWYGGAARFGNVDGILCAFCSGSVQLKFGLGVDSDSSKLAVTYAESGASAGARNIPVTDWDHSYYDGTNQSIRVFGQTVSGTPAATSFRSFVALIKDA